MAFYSGMVELANRPYRQRRDPDAEGARRRERERARLDAWAAQTKYYERCEKENATFERFTSPRYYEENDRLHATMRARREREERLGRRRERLRQLFADEARALELEALMAKCTPRSWTSDEEDHGVPVELLRKANDDRKRDDEARHRCTAERALYDRWARDSAPLRDAQRRCNLATVKMSWLDQQIEKRMRRERDEEEARRCVVLTTRAIEERGREEAERKREAERKSDELRADLRRQMEEVARVEERSARLRADEEAVRAKGAALRALEEEREEAARRRRDEEIAVENQRHHARKLELKARQDARRLDEDRRFVERMREAELAEQLADERRRADVRRSMDEFLALVDELKAAEERRRRSARLAFPSEAAAVFREFDAARQREEAARTRLAHDILAGLRAQLEERLARSRDEQQALLAERERMLDAMRERQEEIDAVRKREEAKRAEYRECLDEQVACKRERERALKEIEQGKREEEWEKLRSEEARLKEEIMRMQRRGRAVQTYGRRSFFY